MAKEAVDLRVTGDSRSAVAAFDKVIKRQDKVIGRLKKQARESRKAGRAGTTMAREMGTQLKSVITGAVGLTAALGLVRKALSDIAAERKRAAELGITAGKALGPLGQLAATPKEFQRLVESARFISELGGQTIQEAAKLQFALTSGGLEKSREIFARLKRVAEEVPSIVDSISGFIAALGQAETGGVERTLSKALAASGKTKTKLNELISAAARAAPEAAAVGTTDEELLAVVALLARVSKDPREAGTQVKRFASILPKLGLGGRGLLGPAQEIAGRGLTEKQLMELMPEQRARTGFRLMVQMMEEMVALTKELERVDVQARRGKSLVRERIEITEAALAGPLGVEVARAREKWAEHKYITPFALKQEEARAEQRTESIISREAATTRWARGAAAGVAQTLGAGPDIMEAAGAGGAMAERVSTLGILRGLINIFSGQGKAQDKVVKELEEINERGKSPKESMSFRQPGGE